MAVFVTLLFLLALWAFIVWERKRQLPPVSREALTEGWSPRSVLKWPVVAGFSLFCLAIGVGEWLNPPSPPFHGRLSFFFEFAYREFGPLGAAYMWWVTAIVFACYSIVLLRNKDAIEVRETITR